MIIAAALCPATPLLARELTGQEAVVPELRESSLAAAVALLAGQPDVVAVVGPAAATGRWDRRGGLAGAGRGGGRHGAGRQDPLPRRPVRRRLPRRLAEPPPAATVGARSWAGQARAEQQRGARACRRTVSPAGRSWCSAPRVRSAPAWRRRSARPAPRSPGSTGWSRPRAGG